MARQRARIRGLREGDACTKYFHLQACHRRRKNYLFAVTHNGQTFSEEEAKADIVFSYYNDLLGSAFVRQHRIDLSQLEILQLDLSEQVAPFSWRKLPGLFVNLRPIGRQARMGSTEPSFGLPGKWSARMSYVFSMHSGGRFQELPLPQWRDHGPPAQNRGTHWTPGIQAYQAVADQGF